MWNSWPSNSSLPGEVFFGWDCRGSLGVHRRVMCAQGCTRPVLIFLCREKGNTPWNTPNTSPAQPALRRKSSTNTWKQQGDFLPKRAKPRADGIPLESMDSLSHSSPTVPSHGISPGWVRRAPSGIWTWNFIIKLSLWGVVSSTRGLLTCKCSCNK